MHIDEHLAHEATIRNIQNEDSILGLEIKRPMLSKGFIIALILNLILIVHIFIQGQDLLATAIMTMVLLTVYVVYLEQRKYFELYTKASSIIQYYRKKVKLEE